MENKSRLYVPDTNIILHDPKFLFGFPSNGHENNIMLVAPVWNELDRDKGDHSIGYASRRATGLVDRLKHEYDKSVPADDSRRVGGVLTLSGGMPISLIAGKTKSQFGKLYLSDGDVSELDHNNRGDANIILAVMKLKEDKRFSEMEIIFVTNDRNCSVSAANYLSRSGIKVEYYKKTRVEKPFDALHDYKLVISKKKWDSLFLKAANLGIKNHDKSRKKKESADEGFVYTLPYDKSMTVYYNQHVIVDLGGEKQLHGIVKEIDTKEKIFSFRILTDYIKKNKVFKFNAKDQDQNFALNIILDPSISCVAILGEAGSGKTLLSLVAAYNLIFEQRESSYSELIVTREAMPANERRELGFLKGDMGEKYGPWMNLVSDNIRKIEKVHNPAINSNAKYFDSDKSQRMYSYAEMMEKTQLTPPVYLRGRSIHDSFILNEETQNDTPDQVLTTITRVAEGTKIVFSGNTNQIDHPHLSPETCGLTHLTKLLGTPEFAMVYIEKTYRSKLASIAIKLLQ